jgi:hypothetical protein
MCVIEPDIEALRAEALNAYIDYITCLLLEYNCFEYLEYYNGFLTEC